MSQAAIEPLKLSSALVAPTKPLSDMTDGEKCLAWLVTLLGPYAGLPDAHELFFEIRCRYPVWYLPKIEKRVVAVEYFPITPSGLWQAASYIATNRDDFDLLSSIHPRRNRSWAFDASPYFACFAVDLDAKGDRGGPKAADKRFMAGIQESRLLAPHLGVLTRSGFHLYWMLGEIGGMGTNDGREAYKRLAKRVCTWVTGPPDLVDTNGTPIWNGAESDMNPVYATATLRPVGSYHHGYTEGDEPKQIQLMTYLPDRPRLTISTWQNNVGLPYLREAMEIPDELKRRREMSDAGMQPHDRRSIPRRTREFLLSGGDLDWQSTRTKVMTAASDIAYACYTQEEALAILCRYITRGGSERKFREFIFQSPGRKFLWNLTPCGSLPEISVY